MSSNKMDIYGQNDKQYNIFPKHYTLNHVGGASYIDDTKNYTSN